MTALAERNSWLCDGAVDEEGLDGKPCALGDDEPKLVRTCRGHRGGAVNGVSFSPSKKQLASGGADSCVMLWHFGPASHAPGTRPTRARVRRRRRRLFPRPGEKRKKNDGGGGA